MKCNTLKIHVLIMCSFLLITEFQPMDIHSLCVHSPAEKHLGGFHFLTIMNKAFIILYRFLWEFKFLFHLGKYLGLGLMGRISSICLT